MKIEVLVSTMRRSDCIALAEKMNIKTKCLIVNQLGDARSSEKVQVINLNEKGLSKSRNECIRRSKADIGIVADDDLVYVDNYEEIVQNAYKKYKEADIIAFEVPSTNILRPTSTIKKTKQINFLGSMKLSSFQLTFKLNSLKENNLYFDELFGAGAKYRMGEENIFLFDCLKKGLKIYFVKEKIAVVNHEESTWFKGYTKKYFSDLGAIYNRMDTKLGKILLIQFLLRKRKLYLNEIGTLTALKAGLEGIRKGKAESNFGE